MLCRALHLHFQLSSGPVCVQVEICTPVFMELFYPVDLSMRTVVLSLSDFLAVHDVCTVSQFQVSTP